MNTSSPTRSELRSALYEHLEAEGKWRAHSAEQWSSIINGTPGPSTDAAELNADCAKAWRRLIDIADRLPVNGDA